MRQLQYYYSGVTRLLPYPLFYGFVPLVPTNTKVGTFNTTHQYPEPWSYLQCTLSLSLQGRRRNISRDIYSDGQNRPVCRFHQALDSSACDRTIGSIRYVYMWTYPWWTLNIEQPCNTWRPQTPRELDNVPQILFVKRKGNEIESMMSACNSEVSRTLRRYKSLPSRELSTHFNHRSFHHRAAFHPCQMISSTKFYASMVLIMLTFASMGMAVPIPEEEGCFVCHDAFERDIYPSDDWCFQRSTASRRR